MPCRCDDYQGSYGAYNGAKEQKRSKKRLDRVTQLLCYLVGELKEDDIFARYAVPELERWASKHHRLDAKRLSGKMDEYLSSHPACNAQELASRFLELALAVHPVSRWHRKWFFDMAEKACARRATIQKKQDKHKALIKRAKGKLTKEERWALGLLGL